MRFIKNGNFTGTDEEVIEILSKYFHKVYNSNVKTDWIVLDDLVQKPIRSDINILLSIHEFEQAIKELILHKTPGSNRVSSNTIKVCAA